MFAFIKNHLLNRFTGRPPEPAGPATASPASTFSRPAPQLGALRGHEEAAGKAELRLPLHLILECMPQELLAKVNYANVGTIHLAVPLGLILPQLNRGAVRIRFGDLRVLAPYVFSQEPDKDNVQITLPLAEVLARLDPSALGRRANQRRLEVPDDIASPFESHGRPAVGSALNFVPEPAAVPPAANGRTRADSSLPVAAPPSAISAEKTVLPASIQSGYNRPGPAMGRSVSEAATPAPFSSAPRPAPQAPPAPSIPTLPPPPIPEAAKSLPPIPFPPVPAPAPAFGTIIADPHFKAAELPTLPRTAAQAMQHLKMADVVSIQPPLPAPQATPAVSSLAAASASPPLRTPSAPVPATAPAVVQPPAPPAPVNSPAPATNPTAGGQTMYLSLAKVSTTWPAAIRQELSSLDMQESVLVLPLELVRLELKRGHVSFDWKTLRGWIQPAPLTGTSPHEAEKLELPLNLLAPLFLARQQKAPASRRQLVLDESIPDLFQTAPSVSQPLPAPPTSAPQPAAVNVVPPPAPATAPSRPAPAVAAPAPSREFITPHEVVSRATELPGVAGALVCLPDGLAVASRLAPDMDGDKLSAFVPLMFSKMRSALLELNAGELNALEVSVNQTPWRVLRLNKTFFAVFGRPGAPLPMNQLAALAAQLDNSK